jgi:hypothetical protein
LESLCLFGCDVLVYSRAVAYMPDYSRVDKI